VNQPKFTAALETVLADMQRLQGSITAAHAAMNAPDDEGPADLGQALQHHLMMEAIAEQFQILGRMFTKGR